MNTVEPQTPNYRPYYLILGVFVILALGIFLNYNLSKKEANKTDSTNQTKEVASDEPTVPVRVIPTVSPLQFTGSFENISVSGDGKTGVLEVKVVTSLPSKENKNGVVTTYNLHLNDVTLMQTLRPPVGNEGAQLIKTKIRWQELKKDKIVSVGYQLTQPLITGTDISADQIKDIQIIILP